MVDAVDGLYKASMARRFAAQATEAKTIFIDSFTLQNYYQVVSNRGTSERKMKLVSSFPSAVTIHQR